jgi:hypothetical protein
MRDFKRRYFLSPPLTDADYIALELKPHDVISTPSGAPTTQVTVETFLVGRHELGITLIYVTGSPGDPANKGYRVWYSVAAPGETPPANPEELRMSFFTKRKKDVLEFNYGDSGKTAYFAVQLENDGKKGPWGGSFPPRSFHETSADTAIIIIRAGLKPAGLARTPRTLSFTAHCLRVSLCGTPRVL